MPKPKTWSRDDWSSLKTWGVLVALGQIQKPFQESGAVKVSQLVFWRAAVAPKQRSAATRQLAQGIDRLFVSPLIEATRTTVMPQAVEELAQVLAVGTNSIAKLAATVHRLYDSGPSLHAGDVDIRAPELPAPASDFEFDLDDEEDDLKTEEEDEGGGSVDH